MFIEKEELIKLSRKQIFDDIISKYLVDFESMYGHENERFTLHEVSNLSVNYAINYLHGDDVGFDEYYSNMHALDYYTIEEKCQNLLYEKEESLYKLGYDEIYILICDIVIYISKKKDIYKFNKDKIFTYEDFINIAEKYKIDSVKDHTLCFNNWYRNYDRYRKIKRILSRC